MAKRVKTETITEELEPQSLDPEPIPDELEEIDALGLRAKKISISRLDATGKFSYVGTLPGGGDLLERTQVTYGGGEYQFRFHNQSGKVETNRSNILIGELKRTVAAPGPEAPDLYRSQFDLMQGQLARQQEMVIHLIDKQGAPAAQNDMVKIIEAMGALRSLADPGAQIKNIVSALTEGMRLGMRQSNGGNGGSESKVDTILKVVDRVSELVPRFIARSPGGPPATEGPGLAPGNPPAAPEPLRVLRGTIDYLKTKVSKDPALWADMIVDNLEESHWRMILELMETPYDEIAERIGDPDLKREPYRSWFIKLLAELKNASQNNGAVDTEREERNGGGPRENERDGPRERAGPGSPESGS